MTSLLVITSVERLQKEITAALHATKDAVIYVSLDKPAQGLAATLKKTGANPRNVFFIDGVVSEPKSEEILHVSPTALDDLAFALQAYAQEIPGKKTVLIDSLATLLIYNDENRVAQFANQITTLASEKEVEVIAFSPHTKGEELLNKIFHFFDEVRKKK